MASKTTTPDVADLFVAEDANEDHAVWLENGDYPIALVYRYEMPPKVWEILSALLPEREVATA